MKNEQEIQNSYIGVDVSKLTLDVSIVTPVGDQDYSQFESRRLLNAPVSNVKLKYFTQTRHYVHARSAP